MHSGTHEANANSTRHKTDVHLAPAHGATCMGCNGLQIGHRPSHATQQKLQNLSQNLAPAYQLAQSENILQFAEACMSVDSGVSFAACVSFDGRWRFCHIYVGLSTLQVLGALQSHSSIAHATRSINGPITTTSIPGSHSNMIADHRLAARTCSAHREPATSPAGYRVSAGRFEAQCLQGRPARETSTSHNTCSTTKDFCQLLRACHAHRRTADNAAPRHRQDTLANPSATFYSVHATNSCCSCCSASARGQLHHRAPRLTGKVPQPLAQSPHIARDLAVPPFLLQLPHHLLWADVLGLCPLGNVLGRMPPLQQALPLAFLALWPHVLPGGEGFRTSERSKAHTHDWRCSRSRVLQCARTLPALERRQAERTTMVRWPGPGAKASGVTKACP